MEVATALIRVSEIPAFKANPPHPQIPKIPILSLLINDCVPKKSTAALKSSVLISGDGTFLGCPPLSPVYEPSNANVTNPLSANV